MVKLLIPVKVYQTIFYDHTIYGLLNKHARVQARYIIYIDIYIVKFFFSMFMVWDALEVNEHTKKNEANIQQSQNKLDRWKNYFMT